MAILRGKGLKRAVAALTVVVLLFSLMVPALAIDEKFGNGKFKDNTTFNWLFFKSTMQKQQQYLTDIAKEVSTLYNDLLTLQRKIEAQKTFLKNTYYYTSAELSKYGVKQPSVKLNVNTTSMETTKNSYRTLRTHLKSVKEANTATLNKLLKLGPKAVTLNGMPNYLQTDKRWSGVKLGSSSYSIGTHGCLVTSIAMAESYFTKKSITPNQIAKNCNSGGAYIWSKGRFVNSNYTGKNYLAEIYKQLTLYNKPVIVGRFNSQSQHWVVVYKCDVPKTDSKGNLVFDETMFKIKDPAGRDKTLADLKKRIPGNINLAIAK